MTGTVGRIIGVALLVALALTIAWFIVLRWLAGRTPDAWACVAVFCLLTVTGLLSGIGADVWRRRR